MMLIWALTLSLDQVTDFAINPGQNNNQDSIEDVQ
jgi:hypothetical protein